MGLAKTFEQNLEGGEGGSHMGIWEKSVPSRRMANTKALRWDVVRAGGKGKSGRRGGQRAAGTRTAWAIKLA